MSRSKWWLVLAWLAASPWAARAGVTDGLGAVGDSFTDEYQFTSYSYARNWLEQLAEGRSLNFGTVNSGAGWGEPRRRGYEFNWARGGATTSSLLTQGQHTGLAGQVADGDVTLAYLGIGANDFGAAYGQIYNGSLSGAALDTFVDDLVARIATALTTLEAAGPVEMVIATIPDYGVAPAFQSGYTNPAWRQRVTDATAAANVQIRALASSRSIPVVDLEAASAVILSGSQLELGGATLSYAAGSNPTNLFVADGVHPHSVLQGLVANLVIEAANLTYGAEIAPFSDQEILENAGITPPGGETTYFPVAPFVVFDPTPGDATLDGIVDGADFTVWGDHFGQHSGDARYRDGDFTGDGFVDGADFTIWADHFGAAPLPVATPEPAGASLGLMSAALMSAAALFGLRSREAATR